MKYKLRYLPIAQDDIVEIIEYIQNVLKNPIAADNVLNRIEEAILDRLDNPESFAIWEIGEAKEHPYRRINVGNYSVWYVVIDDVMEVRRVLYAKRDEKSLVS